MKEELARAIDSFLSQLKFSGKSKNTMELPPSNRTPL